MYYSERKLLKRGIGQHCAGTGVPYPCPGDSGFYYNDLGGGVGDRQANNAQRENNRSKKKKEKKRKENKYISLCVFVVYIYIYIYA